MLNNLLSERPISSYYLFSPVGEEPPTKNRAVISAQVI